MEQAALITTAILAFTTLTILVALFTLLLLGGY